MPLLAPMQKNNRFVSGKQRFIETKVDSDHKCLPQSYWVNKRKILTNLSAGRTIVVDGGVTWKEICEDILKDGTSPSTLARAAKGINKSANGWVVEVL